MQHSEPLILFGIDNKRVIVELPVGVAMLPPC